MKTVALTNSYLQRRSVRLVGTFKNSFLPGVSVN